MTTTPATRRPKNNPAPLSMPGHLRMLARCRKSPATVAEMCRSAGRQKTTGMLFVCSWMLKLEMVHIHSWVKPKARGLMMPRLKFGAGENAPYPGKAGHHFGHSLRGRPTNTLIALKHMLEALDDGATRKQLEEVTGLFPRLLSRALKLGCELGLLRIESWRRRERTGGVPIPTYAIRQPGQDDAARPDPIPSKVLLNRWRQRVYAKRRMGLSVAGNDHQGRAAA